MQFPSSPWLRLAVITALLAGACKSGSPSFDGSESTAGKPLPHPVPSSTASSSFSVMQAAPNESAQAAAAGGATNPNAGKPYTGPTGMVAGVVRMSGDESPRFQDGFEAVPAGECAEARELYGSLFREGADRTVADVLVSVTGYEGVIPAAGNSVKLGAKGCAFPARTIALSLGQHLEIESLDTRSYMPKLAGQSGPAAMVALPQGAPAKLFAATPGLHVLTDKAHPFALATLFVLNYATFDVTEPDGAFSIPNVPVGAVKVSAFLPVISQVVHQEVTVKPNETTRLEFTLHFDRQAHDQLMASSVAPKGTPAPAAAAAPGLTAPAAAAPAAAPRPNVPAPEVTAPEVTAPEVTAPAPAE